MFAQLRALQSNALVWSLTGAGALAALAGCGPNEEPATGPAPTVPAEKPEAVPAPQSAPAEKTPAAAAPANPAPAATPAVAAKEQEIVKATIAKLSPEARLGARLFYDNRLGNPGANLATSCRTCHVTPEASNDDRRWTDKLALSVMPASDRGGKLTTARNTPTLLDCTTEKTFPSDGAVGSLPGYLSLKLTSEHMGWRPGEEEQAKKEIQALLVNDDGSDPLAEGNYAAQFKTVKNVDVATLTPDSALQNVINSIIDYLGTVTTNNSSGYDAVMQQNRYPETLAGEGDTVTDYFGRLFMSRISNEEGRVQVRFVGDYEEDDYQGFKAFFRMGPTWSSSTNGDELNIGNCIACHIPPKFTDNKFHNIGITQFEYDAVHGEGAFMNYKPGQASEKTRGPADKDDPEKADLGRWNVDLQESSIGAFKTPKLRDNAHTDPYMHNGRYASIEEAIRIHLKAAELAKAGKLRNPDPELLKISGITEQDIKNMVKFFEELNEVPRDKYRDFRISNLRIRQDPLGEATFSN
jgi:cytochrome c peroxidase